MSKFIETDRGLVNLDHVTLIENYHTDEKTWSVLSINLGGDVVRVTTEEFVPGRDVIGPVVPAQPGYFTIEVEIDEGGGRRITKVPVVAWYLDEYGYLCPLNSFSCHTYEPVLYPDGRVYEAAGQIWESEEAYLAERIQDVAAKELENGHISAEIAARYLSAERIEAIKNQKRTAEESDAGED